MSKVLFFIYDKMADFEMTHAAHIIGANTDKEVVTIAYEDKIVRGVSGIDYKPKMLVKDVLDEDIDALIITGGFNGEIREELMQLIQNTFEKGKLVAAICAGPRFLARAGILDKVKYTTSLANWSDELNERYQDKGDPFPRENYVMERVVKDKNVITAQGYAFTDFAIEIADWFKLFGNAEEKQEYTKMIKSC